MKLAFVRRMVLPISTMVLFGASTLAATDSVVTRFSYPGGVVELFLPKNTEILPQVRFGTQEPVIIDLLEHWKILIGLKLDTLPGEYLVYVKDAESEIPARSIMFNVEPKAYPILEIKPISNSRNTNIQHTRLSDLDFRNTVQPKLPLDKPLVGQWADVFGSAESESDDQSREVADNRMTHIRNYVSITTTELAPVTAPQNAIVSRITIDEEREDLATVFLDHGRGLYSVISGISDLTIETGNGIVAGAIIGKLPASTSTETPSRLIWQCVLNGVYVNPLILTQLVNLDPTS